MLNYFKELSEYYNVPLQDVISIAINRYGIICKDVSDNRLRFDLNILDNDNKMFFAVCVNTYSDSPFLLKDSKLYLDSDVIAKVSNIEKDTCTSTYFRNNKKAITFNSNSRSKCVGCKFCGTYSLSEDDYIDFSTKDNIKKYFNELFKDNNIESMKQIEDITLCTGCFSTEDKLISHLLLLNETFKEMDFNGRLNYIGFQLRNKDKIYELSKEIPNFGMYLTVEKFLDREYFMKSEKANISMDEIKDLLEYTNSLGITSTFLYILGLEDLKTVKKYMEYFKDSVNKFPIVQVFQNYTTFQENYRCEEAKDVKYYLSARKIIQDTFKDSNLSPRNWECFRGLQFKDKKLRLK